MRGALPDRRDVLPRVLREARRPGHDAVHVRDRGLAARPDPEVAALVAAEDRALVTENVKDFAAEEGIVIVCVLKARLPSGGMHVHLAGLLDRWAKANPDPYRGPHRP